MDDVINGFIAQTANDYSMSYEDVKRIYNKTGQNGFYEELEKFIADRANRINH